MNTGRANLLSLMAAVLGGIGLLAVSAGPSWAQGSGSAQHAPKHPSAKTTKTMKSSKMAAKVSATHHVASAKAHAKHAKAAASKAGTHSMTAASSRKSHGVAATKGPRGKMHVSHRAATRRHHHVLRHKAMRSHRMVVRHRRTSRAHSAKHNR